MWGPIPPGYGPFVGFDKDCVFAAAAVVVVVVDDDDGEFRDSQ